VDEKTSERLKTELKTKRLKMKQKFLVMLYWCSTLQITI